MSNFDVLGASAAILRRISTAKAAPSAMPQHAQPRGVQRAVEPTAHAVLPAATHAAAVDTHAADAHAQQLSAASRHAVSAGNKLARFPRYAAAGKKLLRIAHRSADKASKVTTASKAAHAAGGKSRLASIVGADAAAANAWLSAYLKTGNLQAYLDPDLVNATDLAATVGDIIATVAQLVQQLQAVGRNDIAQQGQQIADALSAAINAAPDDVTTDAVRAASGPKYQAQTWIPTAQSALAATSPPGAPGAPASGGGGGGGSGAPSGGGDSDDSGAPSDDQGDAGAEGGPSDDGAPPADGDEGGAETEDADGADEGGGDDSDDGADASDDVQVGSGFDLIGYADVMGRGGGGGGGHGGGGHGGHGGHGHGHGHGGRGRGRRGGFGWGGWGWGGPWYGDDYLLDDEPSAEEIAEAVARKLKQAKHIGGGGHGGGHSHGGHHGHGHGHGYGRGAGLWGGGPYWEEVDGLDLLDVEELDDVLARRQHHGVGYAAPDTHWYSVATPGAIKDELDKVLHEGETLNRDISSYQGGDAAFSSFLAGWQSFWTGFKKFYNDNASGVGGWLSRLWSVSGDQVVSYGNQLNDWRAKLKSFSGAVVTEPSMTAIQRREDPTKFNYMPLVYGAIAIVALVGGGYALSKVGAVAALFTKKKAAK
jgi:hypothetical protein